MRLLTHFLKTHFNGAARWVAFLMIVVLAVGVLSAYPAASQVTTPTLVIDAPVQVTMDEPITITLTIRQASDIAGYETALLFDASAAGFSGLEQRQNDLHSMGRDVSPFSVIDLPHGVAFGLVSCPVADCVTPQGPARESGASGVVELATLTLHAKTPGLLEFRLDATKFVDAAGNPVEVSLPRTAFTIRVGAPGQGAEYPAPGSMWRLAPSAARQPAGYDLTGDGLVTHADLMEAALQWQLTRLELAPCGPRPDAGQDVNGDGCIDVADLQMLAAQFGAAGRAGDLDGQVQTRPYAVSSTFTVNATGDESDANIGNGICATAAGVCTLRAAIQEANANPAHDFIIFNIPGGGVHTITLTRALPTLNDVFGITIDGYTQPGASPNSHPLVSNAAIMVQIEGGGESNFDALPITTSGNVIRGLAFYKFRRTFWMYGNGAHDNTVIGSFVGTNAAGNYIALQFSNLAHGFHIEQGAYSNYIGGVAPADRNIISGNGSHGVGIWHSGSDFNVVVNNIVGLTPAGDNRLPNGRHALDLNFGASSNVFGGPGSGERNVLSGNSHTGVEVSHSASTTDNRIIGNYIGVDVNGLGNNNYTYNQGRGINVEDGVRNNIFAGNVIGKNLGGGFEINNSYTLDNVIYGNRIGVGVDGGNAGNVNYGLRINASQTIIGPGNIIAFNTGNGIRIGQEAENFDADFNVITQNSIYSNALLGIDLYPPGVNPNDPDDLDDGPNQQLNFPVLNSASPLTVTGTACAGCWVELFVADRGAGQYGQGRTFAGSVVVGNDGTFTANVSGVSPGDYLTSTTTDQQCNSSEFSLNILVTGEAPPSPPPPPPTTLPPCIELPPTPTPTATLPPGVTPSPTPTVVPGPTHTPTLPPGVTPTATLPPGVTPTATLPPGVTPPPPSAARLYLPAILKAIP